MYDYRPHKKIKGDLQNMGIQSQSCAKCGGVMEEGYVPDRPEDKVWPDIWVEGNPGYKGVEKSGRKYRIQAWRCMSCGYLELYADQEI
jgi:predicted nucleic-acid-binding Zn-ribbon protein